MRYQCVSENFIGSKKHRSKHKHKTKSKHKKTGKKSHKKKSDNIDTKSNISLESSIDKNNYIKFSIGSNIILIYCLFKKVKNYDNFIPVTAPIHTINSQIKNFYLFTDLIINIPGKIEYFGTSKTAMREWITELVERSERFLVLDVLIKIKKFPKVPPGARHGNILIFDTVKNEVYHIEPHGVNNFISDKQFKELKDFFQEISPGCRFYQHRDFLKFLPFQTTEVKHEFEYKSKISKDIPGYCFYWCMYLVNIILKFSHLPIKVILKQTYDSLMSHSIGKARITDFHRHIRSWGQRLEQNVIKEYPKLNSERYYYLPLPGFTHHQLRRQLSEMKSVFNL